MAKMYPPLFETPDAHAGARGEFLVYKELEKLPDDWTVIHDYWRFYVTGKGRYVNYESDFIVLIPGRGYVVIEVKNWNRARVHNGQWEFVPRGRQTEEFCPMGHKASPLNQAYLAAKKLNDELCHVRRFSRWYSDAKYRNGKVEYHSLAILLNQTSDAVPDTTDELPADADAARENAVPLKHLYICGQQELQENLQEKIERLFTLRAHRPEAYIALDAQQIGQIVSYLLPSFYLKGDPVAFNRMMEEATAPLHALLPMLEESTQGIGVTGCAGSGKTWMAVREVQRLAETHGAEKKILFLCYNAALAEHVRRIDALRPYVANGCVRVATFPELCMQILGASFGDDWERQSLWYRGLISADDTAVIDDVLCHISPDDMVDYVFIDECQDFLADWGRVVAAIRKPDAKLYAFSDDNQNLFVQGAHAYSPQTATRVRLTRNLRNSSEIARFSSAILPPEHRMQPVDIPGRKVEICKAEPLVEERARLVSFWLTRLMQGEPGEGRSRSCGVRPHQIVVLSPYSPYKRSDSPETVSSKCSLPLVPRLTCRSADCSTSEELLRRWEADENMVMGTTIRAFKGLESDYIILVDVDEPSSVEKALTRNDLYVACTRAKYGLIIIPKSEEGEAYTRRLLGDS